MTASPARLIAGAVVLFLTAVIYAAQDLPPGAHAALSRHAFESKIPLPPALTRFGDAEAFAGAQSQTSLQREPAPGSTKPATAAPQPLPAAGGDYVGSEACARCHAEEYDSWKKTLHLQMTKPIAEAKVLGDFRPGTHVEAHGRSYRMEKRNGRYLITVAWGDDPPQTFQVDYTLGARRFQGYLSRLPDGRIYVLPVFWHNLTSRWVDFKETTPVPDDTAHVRQIWNVQCVNCHATNLVKNYDVQTNTYATTWTEMGIGCEACHGPGKTHIARMDEYATRPRGMPAYDGSASNRELSKQLAIFSPRTADPRQVFDACGYCHGNKTNLFFGFRPGDRYEDYAEPFLISEPLPSNDPQGDFWTDGRPSRFNRPQAVTLSGCFMRGEVTCTRCHSMHNSHNDHALKVPVMADGKTTRQSDLLCTQCHSSAKASAGREDPDSGGAKASAGRDDEPHATAYGATAVPPTPIPDLEAHTHHAPDSPGSRCIECHMSDVNWRLFTRRRDHSFQPPVPEMTARFGVPNACNACHDDKTPEWAAQTMDQWYGNGARRRAIVDMADVLYRAGAGDTSALTQVVRYAVDRTRGALIRASAADFAAQLLAKNKGPVDPVVANSLAGAAGDPEPMVRTAAIRALGYAASDRSIALVAAHLHDEARVARTAAAAALFQLGVARLDGAAGEALARAQADWMASLRTFADVAEDHVVLGWLEIELGNTRDGTSELDTAIRLDPTLAQPHLYLGVVAARAGRFADALKEFKTAKSLDPASTNLDRLITEAEKRLRPGSN